MKNNNVHTVLTIYGIVKLRKESKTGNIQLDYYYNNNENEKKRRKPCIKLKYEKKNIDLLKDWLLNCEMNSNGDFVSNAKKINEKYKVSEFMSIVKESINKDAIREKSKNDYINILNNHFIPIFGDYYLDEIKIHDLEEMFKSMKKMGKDSKTLKNIKVPINKFFENAFKKDIIKYNPMNSLNKNIFKDRKQLSLKGKGYDIETKKQLIENEDNNIDPFTEEEIKLILETAKGKFRNFLGIMYFTGMRPSELICLKWENINIDKKYLIIEEARTGYETQKEIEQGLNKTKAAKRTIDLSEKAIYYIKEQKKYSTNKEGELFETQYGKPYKNANTFTSNYWRKLFDKPRDEALKNHKKNELNIRYRKLYQLRHSFISINLSKGTLNLLYISKMVGHSSPEVTLRKYSKYVKEGENYELKMLNDANKSY